MSRDQPRAQHDERCVDVSFAIAVTITVLAFASMTIMPVWLIVSTRPPGDRDHQSEALR